MDSYNLTALVAGGQHSFRSVRVLNFLSYLEEFAQLHPNRPSDQLSWRTPCRTFVHELGGRSGSAYSPHGETSPTEKNRAHNENP